MISSKSRELSGERTEGGSEVTPSPVQTGEGGWGQAGVAEKRHIFLPPPQPPPLRGGGIGSRCIYRLKHRSTILESPAKVGFYWR